MKLSMSPQPKNGLPMYLVGAVTAIALIVASFAGLAQSASAAPLKGNKIVALTPFSANTMGMLGVQPRAVGEVLAESRGGSVYVSAIENRLGRGIAVLPLTHPNGPNLEKLAKLNPKFVFTSPTWAKGTAAMKGLGIKVQSSDPKSLGQIYSGMRKVGKVVGKSKQANKLVKRTRSQVAKAVQSPTSGSKTVMVILGVGRTPFTFLSNSWGGAVAGHAGARLMTGGAKNSSGFARISDEVVIAEDPDVIVAVPHATKGDIPALIDYMENNPAWQGTSAVQNKRLYVSTDNSLLQAGIDPAKVIRNFRSKYLSK